MEKKEVLDQLARIVADERFAASPQLQSFLQYIVNRTLTGEPERIKAYSIATEALGRDASFDAGTDPIVRVQAGRLRKLLDLYNATDGATDPLYISVPKGSYIPQFERRNETKLTNFELENSSYTDSTEPSVSCAGVGTPLERPVIAVLPAEAFYVASWQNGFCEILEEEILNALNKFETVDTAPLNTIHSMMPGSDDPKAYAQVAGADFIIENRFYSDGTKSRLHVKLTSVEMCISVWSTAYDLKLDASNKIEIAVETANAIVSEVASSFGYAHRDAMWSSRRNNITDLNAYECILQTHLYDAEANEQTYFRALNAAKRAVSILPNCGTAWAKLAELYSDGYRNALGGLEATADYLDAGNAAAKMAYKLCSECAVSSMAMSDVHFIKGNLDRAFVMGEQAIAQNPNNHSIKARFGVHLAYAGEWQRGMALVEEALSHQPVALASYNQLLAEGNFLSGNFQKSLDNLEMAQSTFPIFKEMGKVVNFAGLGQKQATQKALTHMTSIWPDLTLDHLSEVLSRDFSKPILGHYIEGLQEAGLST